MKSHQPLSQMVFFVSLCVSVLLANTAQADEKMDTVTPENSETATTAVEESETEVTSENEAADVAAPDTGEAVVGSDEAAASDETAVAAPPVPVAEPSVAKVAEAPVAAPAPPPPVTQYYILKIGQTIPKGPYEKAALEKKIAQKEISHYDQVRTAGKAVWSRVYEAFPDVVYAEKPQVEVTRRYGLFSSPYRIKVNGEPYSLKRKMKHVGTDFRYGQTVETFEMSGFLYPATREGKLSIPEEYRSGKTFPEYFWPSPLGLHMLHSGVNPGVISKREFNRKMAVLPFMGTGLLLVALGGFWYNIDGEINRETIVSLSTGAGLMAFALLVNIISRRKSYRYLKKLETAR